MKEFFVGLLIMVCLFTFCLVISYYLYYLKNSPKPKRKRVEKTYNQQAQPQQPPNIYYIGNLEKPKTKAPRKRKIDIPIKQAIISPQEIQKIIIDNSQHKKN